VITSDHHVELHHLRYFVAVADALSYRRAAEVLHVTQPALTRAVQQLEAELGVALLARSRVQVSLTKAGTKALTRARAILDKVERLGQGLGGEAAETLRVGHVLPEYFQAGPLLPRLRAFLARHPGASLDVRPLLHRAMLRELIAGRLDAGFAWLPIEGVPRELRVDVVLLDEPLVALPPGHRRASADAIALRVLRGERFVLFPRAAMPERYDEIVTMVERAGFTPNVVQETPSLRRVLEAVGQGAGVSVVPRIAATLHRMNGFTLHPIEGVQARWSLALIAQRAPESEPLKAFLETMRREPEAVGPSTRRSSRR
jgi:DNA-binding transcriptional LysR family regulator